MRETVGSASALFSRPRHLALLILSSAILVGGVFSGAVATADPEPEYETFVTERAPSRIGYTFSGWLINNTPPLVPANTEVTVLVTDDPVVIRASWSPNPVSFSYDLNYPGGVAPSSGSSFSDANFTLAAMPLRTGYVFQGWRINNAGNLLGANESAKMPPTDTAVIIYAQWLINSYTLSYSGNGNSSGVEPLSKTSNFNSNAPVSGPLALTRDGHTFVGWNTKADGKGDGYPVGSIFTFTRDTTLYAQWSANSLTVTFDSQGGSAIANGTTTTAGSITNPGTPTRAGYTFTGWFIASSGGSAITFPYTHNQSSNFTLYAQWHFDFLVSRTVYFSMSSSELSPRAKKTLRGLAKELSEISLDLISGSGLRIVGFAQPTSIQFDDRALSLARANQVYRYLKSRGVTIPILVRGEGRLDRNSSKSRRAEISLVPLQT